MKCNDQPQWLQPVQFLFEKRGNQLMQHKQKAMRKSPNNKFPIGTMPESTYQHGDDEEEVHVENSFPVSAQRNVNVISQPEAQ